MEALGERFGGCFLEKTTATVLTLSDLQQIRGIQIPGSTRAIQIGVNSKQVAQSALDNEIILALAADPSTSIQKIARLLGEPATTVQYRFNQMKKSGVIAGCRYFIDFLRLGHSFVYHQLTLSGISTKDSQALLKYLAGHPAVYYLSLIHI